MRVINQFFAWWKHTFQKQGFVGKIVFGVMSLFIICCLCSVPIGILSPNSSATATIEVVSTPIEIQQGENPTASVIESPTATLEVPSTSSSTPSWELIATQGVFNLVVIDPKYTTDKQALLYVSKQICTSQDICKVLFWDDKSKAANSLPMTDEQVNAEVASYSYNKNTGLDELLICSQGSCNP